MTHEALGGDIGAGKTAGLVGRVDNEPRGAVLPSIVSCWHGLGRRAGGQRTMWLRRLAAPRPVGPMPMTRTSTLLRRGAESVSLRLGSGRGRAPPPTAAITAWPVARARTHMSAPMVAGEWRCEDLA